MIPNRIARYLAEAEVSAEIVQHPRAVSAQMLAQALHVSGHQVAKSLLVAVDESLWLAVLPAPERLDPLLLGTVLGAHHIEMCSEATLAEIFYDCEVGAEPPFGSLYGVPVVMDMALAGLDELIVRAGSHEEALRLSTVDYIRLEDPKIGAFSVLPEQVWQVELEYRP